MSEASLAAGAAPEQEIRQAAYRKAQWRIAPFLMLCYVVNLIDRTNIGFAQIYMRKDLGFTDAVYGTGIAMFFVAFLLFEVPSNLLLARIGVRKTLLRIMVAWGVVSSGTFMISDPVTYYISRFLLGMAEAGFFPGVLLYLTFWFPSDRRTRLIALFLLALPCSGFIGSAAAGWIMHGLAGALGLAAWQWLFIIEGIPAVLLGISAFLYFDDGPRNARWLTPEQKRVIESDLAAEQVKKARVKHYGFATALKDPRVYAIGVVGAGTYVLSTSTQYWLPLIISAPGVTNILSVGLLSSIPPLFGLVAMLLVGRSSDLRLERRWHMACPEFIGALSMLLISLLYHEPYVVVILLALMTAGHYSGVSVYWSLPSIYLSEEAAAGGIAAVTAIASIGGALTPLMLGWIRVQTGNFSLGLQVSAGLICLGSLVLLLTIPARVLRERKSGD